MATTKRTITYTQDPGHGWISVSHDDVRTLGLTDKISRSSYMNDSRVFLEEDYDAGLFMDAAKAAGWDVKIKSSHVDRTQIRSLEGYCRYWINNPLQVGSIVSNRGTDYEIKGRDDKGRWLIGRPGEHGWIYAVKRSNPFRYLDLPLSELKKLGR